LNKKLKFVAALHTLPTLENVSLNEPNSLICVALPKVAKAQKVPLMALREKPKRSL